VAVDVAFLGWEEGTLFDVVGVVEDYKLSSLDGSPRAAMFFPFAQQPPRTMRIAVATAGSTASLIRPIQERIWKLDRGIVLSSPQTMSEVVSSSLAGTRSITTVLGLFAAVALALAVLGLHGVLAFLVGQRAREIGIRVALGASRTRVLRMVLAWGMMLVVVGVIIGTVGALGATRLVESMLFQISATDPVSLAGAAGFFLLIALAACLLPAWRAASGDPLEALRME
jgi:hypothetical protein